MKQDIIHQLWDVSGENVDGMWINIREIVWHRVGRRIFNKTL